VSVDLRTEHTTVQTWEPLGSHAVCNFSLSCFLLVKTIYIYIYVCVCVCVCVCVTVTPHETFFCIINVMHRVLVYITFGGQKNLKSAPPPPPSSSFCRTFFRRLFSPIQQPFSCALKIFKNFNICRDVS